MSQEKENPAEALATPSNGAEIDLAIGSENTKSAQLSQASQDRINFVCRNILLDDALSAGQKRAFFMGVVGMGLLFVEEIDGSEPARPIGDLSAPVRGLLDMIATPNDGGEQ